MGRHPGALFVAPPPTLLTNARFAGVGVKRLVDEFVGDVGSVELRGVDVVDAQLDCAAQHGQRLVVVTGWPEYAGTG